MKTSRLGVLTAAVLAATLSTAACSGDTASAPVGDATSVTTITGRPTTDTASGTGTTVPDQLSAAVDDFVAALSAHDRDRLHDAAGGALQQRLQDRDYDRLLGCTSSDETIEVTSYDVTLEGTQATVRVVLQVSESDHTPREVERVWQFEQAPDGTWGLATLPDCPLASTSSSTSADAS